MRHPQSSKHVAKTLPKGIQTGAVCNPTPASRIVFKIMSKFNAKMRRPRYHKMMKKCTKMSIECPLWWGGREVQKKRRNKYTFWPLPDLEKVVFVREGSQNSKNHRCFKKCAKGCPKALQNPSKSLPRKDCQNMFKTRSKNMFQNLPKIAPKRDPTWSQKIWVFVMF